MTRIPVGRDRRGPGILAAAFAALVVIALAIGCGQPTPTPSTSITPASSADAVATPRPTPWPGNAVLGIVALGVADGQILAALNDFNTGVSTENLSLMREAANGLAGLDVLLPNLDKIDTFEPMRSFADRYGAAIRAIVAAAKSLRTAIDGQDAPAITSSSQELVKSFSLYTAVEPELAAWVEQSTDQQRLLTR